MNKYIALSHQQLETTIDELNDNLIELARIDKMLKQSPVVQLLEKGEEGSNLSFWLQQTTTNHKVTIATNEAIASIKEELKRRKIMVGNR